MSARHRVRHTLLTMGLASAAACGGEPEEEPIEAVQPIVTDTPVAQPAQGARPDTTAEGIWAFLQEVDYRESWRRWPGTAELYPGVEPHGMLLTTYVNDLAHDALTNGAATMPPGAIIVKENYMPDSTFAAVTTMYKVQGYNPEHQDWFFAKHDPQGMVDVFGREPMCQDCHSTAPGGDYLYNEVPR